MPKNDEGESREADAASTDRHGRAPERQRIAKLMARAGLCSRRDAEAWITQGRVTLNGAVLSSPAVDVGADDVVLVDGLPLPDAEKTRLFLFHKPRGLVTSDHDPEGRPTVADHLRAAWPEGPRVVTVGRLDINTEGLLLLTNDGGLARVLELPQTGWVRRYRVRAKGQTDQTVLDGLREGVTIEGVAYAGIEARLDRAQGSNCWLTMGLREGKNREVKRVLEHVGLEVNRLIRLSFGPFQLGDLPEGEVTEVKTRILRDQLGEALAAQAGVDFHEDEVVQASPSERRPRPAFGEPSKGKPRAAAPARIVAAPRAATRSPRATARPRGGERRDERSDDVAPAKRERPVTGPRKHVSLLRAGSSAKPGSQGPRKRVERTSTRDHADREIAVDRVATIREVPSRAGPGARSGRAPPDPIGGAMPLTSRQRHPRRAFPGRAFRDPAPPRPAPPGLVRPMPRGATTSERRAGTIRFVEPRPPARAGARVRAPRRGGNANASCAAVACPATSSRDATRGNDPRTRSVCAAGRKRSKAPGVMPRRPGKTEARARGSVPRGKVAPPWIDRKRIGRERSKTRRRTEAGTGSRGRGRERASPPATPSAR